MYSLELTQNGLIFQTVKSRLKHGALGKVIFECNLKTCLQIIAENT